MSSGAIFGLELVLCGLFIGLGVNLGRIVDKLDEIVDAVGKLETKK
jgi:hypothetical protein